MGGGGSRTVYQETKTPNDYNDAWIRSKFGDLDKEGVQFSNWMAGRQANLGREQQTRDELRAGLSDLRASQAASAANIENLQKGSDRMNADFAGLGGQQQQQMKDLYNLANQAGSGVSGVQGPQGITFTKPKTQGTNAFKQGQLQTGSLNI